MRYLTTLLTAITSLFLNHQLSAQCFSEQSYADPGEYTYIVPGASSESFLIEIEARGGDGGDFIWSGNPQSDGGEGATMGASFIVNGGDELFIIVGESGSDALGSPGGGGGGGGTAVIINGSDVLIAAAAGGGGGQLEVGFGAGASTNSTAGGGAGPGTSGGGGFNEDGQDGVGGTGGGAGTLTAQGAGGTQGVVAGPGGNGFGGGAGGSGTVGGGGGGYQGGDGATGASGNYGGMGGDSYITTLYSSITLTTNAGANGGGANVDGNVTITCIPTSGVELALVSQSDPLCLGSFDGTIEVTGLGGVAPYTYQISGGGSQDNGLFENLAAGTYTITVFDGQNDTAFDDFTLVDPPALDLSLINTTDASCPNSIDGSFEVEGSGGTGPYTYALSGGPSQGSGIFDNLMPGDYLVVVTDDNGCVLDLSVTVGSPGEIDIDITSQMDASCEEANNGSITFSASGGQGNYTYSIDGMNFQMPSTFNDLSSDDYTVTVQDDSGCTNTLDFSIGISDPFTFLILDTSDTNCGQDDGSVNMLATGGVGGYTYSIDGGASQMSGSFADLAAGTYSATATDAGGCIQEISFTIEMGGGISYSVDANGPICHNSMNGFIDLTLDPDDGPYTFTWTGEGVNPTSEDQTNLDSGIYGVVIEDSNGCNVIDEIILQPGPMIDIEIVSIEEASCADAANGSVTLAASGGESPYLYNLDGSSNITGEFSGLLPGDYEIEVEDITGCTDTISITITAPAATFTLMVVDQTEAGCNGVASGTISLLVEDGTGTIFYTIDGMTNTTGAFTGLSSGVYTARATDDTGCSVEIEVTILEDTTLSGATLAMSNVSCTGAANGSIAVIGMEGAGDYMYALNAGESQSSGEFEGLAGGDYSIEITDAAGCSFLLPFEILEPTELIFTLDSLTDATCTGVLDGALAFHVEGGTAPYLLVSDGLEISVESTDTVTFDQLEASIIDIGISDANGCSIDTSVTINTLTTLEFVVDYLTNVSCNGAGDATFGFHLEGGMAPYTLTTTDGDVFDIPNNEIQEFDEGEPLQEELFISDVNGCTTNYTLIVTEPDPLELVINELIPAPCNGGEAFISFSLLGGTAPYLILDEDGDSLDIANNDPVEINEAEGGTYPLTLVDANQCMEEVTVTIPEPPLLEIDDVDIINDDGSGNGSITIIASGGTGAYSYSINDGDFQTESTFNGLSNGDYNIIVVDENGCSTESVITILSTDVNDISEEVLIITLGPNPASEQINITLDLKESIEITLKLTDMSGRQLITLKPNHSLGKKILTMDTKDLKSGMYLVYIETSIGNMVKKIFTQN